MYSVYTVKVGDTLDSIAKAFNTTKEELAMINGLNPDYVVSVSENIVVPLKGNQDFEYYTVLANDNLYQIARNHNTTEEILANLNGLNVKEFIYPNQILLVPREGVTVYITKEGDTLSNVSNSLGITTEDLIRQNRMILLLPDQIIVRRN